MDQQQQTSSAPLTIESPTGIELPIVGPDYERPSRELLDAFATVSSATASAMLHLSGVTHTFLGGPRTRLPGARVIGSALTLQFMPLRGDIWSVTEHEMIEQSALWAVCEATMEHDVLVIQAYGDPSTGCVGDVLTTRFKHRGGIGMVIDGCVRDWPHVKELGIPMWTTGVTPNFASQSGLMPWAHSVPISCGGALVLPGDIIIADDDGAVVIPRQVAPHLLEAAQATEDSDAFSRARIREGGSLYDYYPLTPETAREFETWCAARHGGKNS